jgi:DNA-binding protein HU-beta
MVATPKAFGKKDMTEALQQAHPEISGAQAGRIVDTVFDTIVKEVATGNGVTILGFGSWEKKHREARKGRNPGTGAELDIPAKDVPTFSAAKNFKEVVATGDLSKLDRPKKTAAKKAA